jgi:hypothetical protein
VLGHVTRTGTRRRYAALSQRHLGQAVQLYRAGRSLREIGISFGVHAGTVGRYLAQVPGPRVIGAQGRRHQGLADIAERHSDDATALEHLETGGTLFAQHGATYYLNQVLAKKEVLKA